MKRSNARTLPPRPNLRAAISGLPPGLTMPKPMPALSRGQEFELAVAHHQAGRIAETEKVCARILARNPRDSDALHLRGIIAAQAGRFDEAATLIRRAIDIHPSAAGYYRNLANALKDGGKLEAAIAPCRKFLQLQPGVAEMHNQLGHLLLATGKPAEAVVAFREAVRLNPAYAEAWNNLGMALAEVEQVDEAIAAYRQSIAFQPMPQTWNNLGNVLKAKGLRDQAIEGYRTAVRLMPESAEMWNNLGNTLRETGALGESIAALKRSVELNPELVSAQWNLALALLQHGDLAAGFAGYEWRWRLKEFPSKLPKYSKPQWTGDAIAGRTLLLHVEQGRGDVFQFIRYAALVAERGGNVILHCPAEIARVLRDVPGVKQIISTEEPAAFDVHCPLMSLPHLLGTTLETIPAKIPYIFADAGLVAAWRERLSTQEAGKRVGLVWAGSPAHAHDNRRSMTLEQFQPLSRAAGVTFYTLQKGESAAQAANPPAGMTLIDHTADLKDFADTAAMISQLDLVIAVDTAVAHLAGAMGKPVWMLVPFVPDWRWMSGREDTPWYPTMRLFRQRIEGDWTEVIGRVAEALTLRL